MVIEIPFEKLDPVYQEHVREGWAWGCECGESHRTQESAESCRKCIQYLDRFSHNVYYTEVPK